MLANSKLALALSAGLVALLTGCGGGGGGGGNPPPDQGQADTVGGQVTATGAEDNTPTTPRPRRVAVDDGTGLYITADGSLLGLGTFAHPVGTSTIPNTEAVKVNGLPPIASVDSSTYSSARSIAIARNGEVWAWGNNTYLEFAPDDRNATQRTPLKMINWGTAQDIVTCESFDVALILKADGSLRYSPGTIQDRGGMSTLGTVAGVSKVNRIATGMQWSPSYGCRFIAITDSGAALNISIERTFSNDQQTLVATATPLQGLPALTYASCSDRHCLAQASNGTVWAWGDNSYGQLGDGTTTGRSVPVEVHGLNKGMLRAIQAVNGFSMAITIKGGLVLWGGVPGDVWNELCCDANTYPGLVPTGYTLPFQYFSDDSGIVEMADRGGIFVLSNGDVLNWGTKLLGNGTLDSTGLSAPVQALGINLN